MPSSSGPRIPPPIDTPEAALRWAEETVVDCERARAECDIILPDHTKTLEAVQRRRMHHYLVRHGYALGVITSLFRTQQISVTAYNELVARTRATLVGSVVGTFGRQL